MALHVGVRNSKAICSFTRPFTPYSSQLSFSQARFAQDFQYQKSSENNNDGSTQRVSWKQALKFGATVSLAALAFQNFPDRKDLLAEDSDESNITQEVIDKENR